MLFALESMCFFDAIADESRARLEVEFVNLSFSANEKKHPNRVLLLAEKERFPFVLQLAQQAGRR